MSLNNSKPDHLKKISLEQIQLATNNFSDDNVIGRGGFGLVYKGQLCPSTKLVAIKRLDEKLGGQGQGEFLMEINMLSRYKHDNLVSLVGFCDQSNEKILVYEYEARGSLDRHLAATTDLTWVKRLHVCLGAARGLNYLNNGLGDGHRVFHRDIKSPNILLDENWNAKISDFGLSKILVTNKEINSYVKSYACGTIGYIDPQYQTTNVLTKESDVYAFGVVLFEVLCGRLGVIYKYKADDDRRFLSQLARRHYKDGTLEDIINQDLRKQIKPKSLRAFSRIAYQCLKKDRKRRPTMELVIEELQNSLEFQISCQRITRIGLWGSSTCGNPWSFPLDDNQKLRQIRIDHKNWIYSLAFTTQDSNGLLHHSQHYGGEHGDTGGRISEVNFDADEQIVGIVGTVGITYGWPLTTGWVKGLTVISSLSFVTNKKTDGPFGNEAGGVRFSVPWDAGSFAGFYGRAGLYMDGLGFYLKSVTLLE
uniref:probable serine/threonine-protein kinase PBL28 isoform X1 n=1 Tax=Erigeron canadensis TaxID=72917 RepID=UPI001CB914AD|nr:probable serine/threonine-protein kinase PBL28 isoform X1 [Erigeron canadensis]